jgi:hypothetical protein
MSWLVVQHTYYLELVNSSRETSRVDLRPSHGIGLCVQVATWSRPLCLHFASKYIEAAWRDVTTTPCCSALNYVNAQVLNRCQSAAGLVFAWQCLFN